LRGTKQSQVSQIASVRLLVIAFAINARNDVPAPLHAVGVFTNWRVKQNLVGENTNHKQQLTNNKNKQKHKI
jgi:hypothetical protein